MYFLSIFLNSQNRNNSAILQMRKLRLIEVKTIYPNLLIIISQWLKNIICMHVVWKWLLLSHLLFLTIICVHTQIILILSFQKRIVKFSNGFYLKKKKSSQAHLIFFLPDPAWSHPMTQQLFLSCPIVWLLLTQAQSRIQLNS